MLNKYIAILINYKRFIIHAVVILFTAAIFSQVCIAENKASPINPVDISTSIFVSNEIKNSCQGERNLFMKRTAISVVDSHTCKKLVGTDSPFMLIIHKGENLTDTIIKCADAINIKSAMLTGLGALENPTLAYYNLETKQYQNKTFSGIYELISLNGNIAFADDKRVFHIHVAIGDDKYHVYGGHLVDALVGVTAEVMFVPFKAPIFRKFDSDIGLKLISPDS